MLSFKSEVHAMFNSLAKRDRQAVFGNLSRLDDYNVDIKLRRLIGQLVDLDVECCLICEGVYLVTDVSLDSINPFISQLSEQVLNVRGLLGCEDQFIIVDARSKVVVLPFTEIMAENVRYVRLDFNCLNQKIIIHELAHAFLWSGNRVLDEGFADWISNYLIGENIFYDNVFFPFSIRTLLRYDFSNDAHFESIAQSRDEQALLRKSISYIINRIYLSSGTAGIRNLFDRVSAVSPADICELVESVLGQSLESLELAGISDPERELRSHIHNAQINGDLEQLRICAENAFVLFDRNKSHSILDLAITCSFAEMRERARRGLIIDPSLVSVTDFWVKEAKRRGLPPARQAALAGHRSLVGMMVAWRTERHNRVALEAARAERSFREALVLDASDTDAHAALAFLTHAIKSREGATDSISHVAKIHPSMLAKIEAEDANVPDIHLVEVQFDCEPHNGVSPRIENMPLSKGECVGIVSSEAWFSTLFVKFIKGEVAFSGQVALQGTPLAMNRFECLSCAKGQFESSLTMGGYSDNFAFNSKSIVSQELIKSINPAIAILDNSCDFRDVSQYGRISDVLFGKWGKERIVIIVNPSDNQLDYIDKIFFEQNGVLLPAKKKTELIRDLGWVWRGQIFGVNAIAAARILRTLPDFQSVHIDLWQLDSYGGPRYGRALAEISLQIPNTGISIKQVGLSDIVASR